MGELNISDETIPWKQLITQTSFNALVEYKGSSKAEFQLKSLDPSPASVSLHEFEIIERLPALSTANAYKSGITETSAMTATLGRKEKDDLQKGDFISMADLTGTALSQDIEMGASVMDSRPRLKNSVQGLKEGQQHIFLSKSFNKDLRVFDGGKEFNLIPASELKAVKDFLKSKSPAE